ncbi:MAG: 3-oxoacyl-[acyl-carrier-protein] reductase [Candidatus Kapabacteria bacterium]|nr:3-oxoacyl-[acyl-carrier-protein] reductase [Ignavibacteriota bacterium]MCW5885166.1 3-oxoacyl-[acyl-carrier-protein] reductase [Candidatus Kapabacteria bacterium]
MLKDKIVIVTGGTKGIGKAICTAFAGSGAKVYAFGRNIPEDKSTFTENQEINNLIDFVKVDVSNLESVTTAVGEIAKKEGRIDILVNNAGVTKDNLLIRMSEDDWDFVMDINLKGTFNCIKAVSRTMMGQRYGRIINIGSIVGTIGNPGQANYSASKSGLVGLTKALAKELASRNITVNLLSPGYVATEMTQKLSEEQREYFVNNIPLKRVAQAEEIASVVMFFAGDGANYITGQVLHIDGGLAM